MNGKGSSLALTLKLIWWLRGKGSALSVTNDKRFYWKGGEKREERFLSAVRNDTLLLAAGEGGEKAAAPLFLPLPLNNETVIPNPEGEETLCFN